ncbi:hypothetical protein GCM10009744_62180 [Kribbella alba]|uniref:non-specific serine/threonine protein kinase n=1 Tax=Kribbella alba TaxID=190197 RepID=A0ABN2FVH2_9ACTN
MLVAGRYRLGDPLGRGGMGEVYRATDEVLGRDVAIKLLLPVRETLATKERFLREARAAAMVDDPHVVAALDFGSHEGGYFIAMELVEGPTVSQELRRLGPLPADRAVDIVRQAAAGLAAAHHHGIVHRDIKPGNLLLTGDGLVKVADFGIARFDADADADATLTGTGQIIGTSQYLAPERALGGTAGAASDVYALGCVLYQLVSGQPPFLADDPASIMYQHVEMAPTRPSLARPELAGEFEDLLYWTLAKDPDQRPTARQVADGVAAPVFVAADPIDGVAAPVLVAADPIDGVAGSGPLTAPQASPQPPRRRGPSQAVLAGLAAAIIAISATTIGILLQSDTLKLPTTNDLAPHPGVITPAGKPAPTPGTSGSVGTPGTSGSVGTPSTAAQAGATSPTTPQSTRPTTTPTSSPTGGPTTPSDTSSTAPPSTAPTSAPTTAPTAPPTTAPTTNPTPEPTTESPSVVPTTPNATPAGD